MQGVSVNCVVDIGSLDIHHNYFSPQEETVMFVVPSVTSEVYAEYKSVGGRSLRPCEAVSANNKLTGAEQP